MKIKISFLPIWDRRNKHLKMGTALLQAETGAKEYRFPVLIKRIIEAEPCTNAIIGYKNLDKSFRWVSFYFFPLFFIKIYF